MNPFGENTIGFRRAVDWLEPRSGAQASLGQVCDGRTAGLFRQKDLLAAYGRGLPVFRLL